MKRTALILACLAVASWGAAGVAAEEPSLEYYFPEGIEFDPTIPTPREHFGFEVGEWHLRHRQTVGYFERLAELSDRMELFEYARSHEFKPLVLLKVSHPDNLADIDAIRERHLSHGDPERSGDPVPGDDPVVLWMGYSVHGNEPSGANASTLFAYYLAAARGEEIESRLRRMVVLVDPGMNPDGIDRFAHWANKHRGRNPVADRNHREHRQGWPSARTNHYWFDLNRDWLPLAHPESRGRLEQFDRWHPHILTDYHEMQTDRTYFFQPGVPERNNPLTPERNFELTAKIARFNAASLDRIGELYFTREVFDDFYVGKASTYPDLNGTIGILYEQASSRGHRQDSIHGVLTFPYTIRNQLRTSLSNLDAADELREELLEYRRWFYTSAREEAAAFPVAAYLFGGGEDPARTYHLLDLLRRHRIEVRRLEETVEAEGVRFEAGSAYAVPVEQREFRLVQSLFERRTEFEENVFYDVSTWTLPAAFNLDFAEWERGHFDPGALGEPVGAPEFPAGRLVGGESGYAYLFSWDGYYAPRALHRLLEADVLVKGAHRPIEIETAEGVRTFGRGSILVPVGRQPEKADTIHELVRRAAEEDGIDVFALDGGLAESGIDLGSPSFAVLEKPRIALIVGRGVTAGGSGEIRHLFDTRVDTGITLLEWHWLGSVDLNDYNVVILADGSYGNISSSGRDALRHWLRGGGTLVASERAVRWAADNDLAEADYVERENGENDERERLPYGEADRIEQEKRIAGAIFRAHVDSTHPLGFGYDNERVYVMRRGTNFLRPSEHPYATPAAFEESPLVSGYVSAENLDRLAGSALAVVSPQGSGRAILFSDNLNFRAFWYGGNKLFLNAVYFGPTVRNIRLADE